MTQMNRSQKNKELAPLEVKNLQLFLTRKRAKPLTGAIRYHGGFSLIEMLVSIGIFSVVMVIALGALVSMSEADRKAQTLNSAINNLSAGLDSMMRSIRTGTTYHCGSDGILAVAQECPSVTNGDRYFSFLANDGTQMTYCLSQPGVGSVITLACNTSTACGAGNTCSILRQTSSGGPFVAMTAPEVNISNLTFFTRGAPVGDGLQAKVTILINGAVNVTATKQTTFNIQTSVTLRDLDN